MPTEISIPFRLGSDSRITMTSNPNNQIRQHVMSLINTEPGERTALPEYGIPLAELLFEEGEDAVAADLADHVSAQFSVWEPGVALHDVALQPGPHQAGLASVDVLYARTDAPDADGPGSGTNSAVVRSGGLIQEVIRG